MRLRIARKIERAVRRGHADLTTYSREQVRRACVRVYLSPLQVTSVNVFDRAATDFIGRTLRGRSMVISPRLAVFEQPQRLFDVVREDDRRRLQPRTA